MALLAFGLGVVAALGVVGALIKKHVTLASVKSELAKIEGELKGEAAALSAEAAAELAKVKAVVAPYIVRLKALL